MTTIGRHIISPRQAHQVMSKLFQDVIRPYTAAHGHGVLIWQTASDYRRHQLRKAFHGPVLAAIAEQLLMADSTGKRVRWTKAAWKKALAQEFLPARFEEYTTAAGDIKMRQLRASTEAVSDDDFRLFLHGMAWCGKCADPAPEEGGERTKHAGSSSARLIADAAPEPAPPDDLSRDEERHYGERERAEGHPIRYARQLC